MAVEAKQFLKFIAQNPFRILGVYTNASQKEILANANKIKAYNKVRKTIDFPFDNLLEYPTPERSEKTVWTSLKSLDFDKERFKHSIFWLTNETPFDKIALQHLAVGNVDKAISIWCKIDSVSALQNRLIAAAIKHDWHLFATSASQLFEKYPSQVCEKFGVMEMLSSEQLMIQFLELINADNPTIINELYSYSLKIEILSAIKPDNGNDIEICHTYNNGYGRHMTVTLDGKKKVIQISTKLDNFSDDYILAHRNEFVIVHDFILEYKPEENPISQLWVECIHKVLAERLISETTGLIAKIHAIDMEDFIARRDGAIMLLNVFKSPYFKHVLSSGIEQAIRSKVVKEAIDCVIDYYNYAEDQDAVVDEACSLAYQLRSQAQNTIHFERIHDNYLRLKNHAEKLPPKEILYYRNLLEARIDRYNSEPSTIIGALNYIKDCAPYLMSIKEIIGASHSYYIRVSTQVAAAVVNDVVDDFNKQSDDILTRIKNVSEWEKRKLHDKFKKLVTLAATAMHQLTFFGMDSSFKAEQFQPSYDIIKRNAISSGAIRYNDYDQSNRANINIPSDSSCKFEDFLQGVDTRDETGYFQSCKSVADCQNYLRIFPNGKYSSSVYAKMEEFSLNDCKTHIDIDAFCKKYPNTKLNIAAKRDEITYKFCKSANDFRLYLKRYPYGRFVARAKEQYDDLSFKECVGRRDYIKYLENLPNGRHSLEALHVIDDLDFKCCRTLSDFGNYLIGHPHGCHVKEARNEIDNLTFAGCSSEESYFEYLKKFPSGLHSTEAHEKLADYQLWKECRLKNTRKFYKEYLTQFPNGIYRIEAETRLHYRWHSYIEKIPTDKTRLTIIALTIIAITAIGIIRNLDVLHILIYIIGGLAAIGCKFTFSKMRQGKLKPFIINLSIAIISLGIGLRGILLEDSTKDPEHQKYVEQKYIMAVEDGSIYALQMFLLDYADSRYAHVVRNLLYDKLHVSDLDDITWFAARYYDTDEGKTAYLIMTTKCDSILESYDLEHLKESNEYQEALSSVRSGSDDMINDYMENIINQDEIGMWDIVADNNDFKY
ncbi:MAG: hypothetical protein K2L83_00495 [Muribaculaceae bacterium]|nr:hypothetical protein [Muribaculaceae bacterium]